MIEEKPKSKKTIFLVAIIVLVIVVAIIGIGVLLVSRAGQRQIINEEIAKINQTGEVDIEIKSKGKYAEVEKVLKDYFIEYQAIGKEIGEQYKNEKFATILSADNLKNDGPEFTESRQMIADTKAKGEEVKIKLAEMVSNEYKEKRAIDNGLSGKYKDLFVDSIKFEQELETVSTTIDNVNDYLTKVEDIYNLLSENKGKWEVDNGNVEFNEISLLTKYKSAITEASIAANKIK